MIDRSAYLEQLREFVKHCHSDHTRERVRYMIELVERDLRDRPDLERYALKVKEPS